MLVPFDIMSGCEIMKRLEAIWIDKVTGKVEYEYVEYQGRGFRP
jgi:hypothetical protein